MSERMRSLKLAVAVTATTLLLAASASAAPSWAPAASAPIHPGVNTDTQGGSCTSNFIFYDAANVYIGQAAHCSSTGAATDTDGCTSVSLPEGTSVQVDGASQPGTMVYNSWIRMQARGESDPNACAYNDLALVKLAPADAANVNPSIPFWGGPTAGAGSSTSVGKVLSYGNSILRQGIALLSPKEGVQLTATDGGGWNHTVFTVTPGIPGDSGSAFLDKQGRPLGVLSTLQLAPLPAANGVGDIGKEVAYLRSFPEFAGIQLATGTEPFRGPLLPLP
jgi:hypothetical protein